MKVINTYMIYGLLPMMGEYQIYNHISATPSFVVLHECENDTWMIGTEKGFAMIPNRQAQELLEDTRKQLMLPEL